MKNKKIIIKMLVIAILVMAMIITSVITTKVYATDVDIKDAIEAGGTVTLDASSTYTAEQTQITKSVIIEGNGATITGSFIVTGDNIDVQLKNVTIKDGSDNTNPEILYKATNSKLVIDGCTLDNQAHMNTDGTYVDNMKILRIEAPGTDVTVNNSSFVNFVETGLWASALKTISVTNSKFNGVSSEKMATLTETESNFYQKRSAAGIDLNLGDINADPFTVEQIKIEGNTFSGIKAVTTVGGSSTAGGLKVKIKNSDKASISNQVIINNNKFEDNIQDVVIGTQTPTNTAKTVDSTSKFNIKFTNNSTDNSNKINVKNNGATTPTTEEISSDAIVERNYATPTDTTENTDKIVINLDGQDYTVNYNKALNTNNEIMALKNKTGYTFIRFTDKDGNTFDENTVINSNQVLKTVFTINKYIVKIDGTDYAVDYNKTLKDYQEIMLLKNKVGYTFEGFLNEGGSTFDENTKITNDYTLTTSFKAITYKLTVDGKEYTIKYNTALKDYPEIIALKQKEYYTFVAFLDDKGNKFDENTIITKDETLKTSFTATVITVAYTSHVQDKGWIDSVSNGATSGTVGESKRIEALKLTLSKDNENLNIRYKVHVQDKGWMDWSSNGELAGTTGESKRIEAIEIDTQGELAKLGYALEYRVHVQDIGWMDWVSEDTIAGTTGESKRIEAIEIRVVKIADKVATIPGVAYQGQVQDIGWMNWNNNSTSSEDNLCGTTGKALRLETLKISLLNAPEDARVSYQVHIQNLGWTDKISDGNVAGTVGQGLRIEAIKINTTNLTGYKLEYRVHVQDIGWTDWKSNGEIAGTTGESKRIEAIEIKVVEDK